jgi:WhiB family transcriptional regulator, redox-sensing transcriptional regulator
MDSRSRVPENWFIDPIRLGVAGAYSDAEGDPLAWQADALCAQTDPEAFFPEKGGSTRDAKRICSGCDVKAQCLDYALANDERFGIWGGLSTAAPSLASRHEHLRYSSCGQPQCR